MKSEDSGELAILLNETILLIESRKRVSPPVVAQ